MPPTPATPRSSVCSRRRSGSAPTCGGSPTGSVVWYTVLAFAVAVLGWVVSGDPERFLAVLVIATPCPLLIAVPVAIIGAISLAAKRGIIVKDPGDARSR